MKKFIFTISILLTFCFLSCKNMFIFDNLETGSVSVQLPGAYSARKVGEEIEDVSSILYTIELKSLSDNYTTTQSKKPNELASFENLVPGKYNVSIKYESNIFLLAGETEVEVRAGKNTEANVTLKDTAVFSDPHVTVEQSSEYGIKFTVKRLPEDMDKYWGSPRIMNYNYGVGLETSSLDDNYNELVFYWPFTEKDKKYVFTLENLRGEEWVTKQISVVYKEESTKYKLNVDQLNNYFDNVQIKVTGNNNVYSLSFDGIEKGFEHKIFENLKLTEGWVDAEYWVGNSMDSLHDKYLSTDYYGFQTNLHNRTYDVSGMINYYCAQSYGYKYSTLNVRPNFWSESFKDQVFYLNQIITDPFEVSLPEFAQTPHFSAEKVSNGIKITLKKDSNYEYFFDNPSCTTRIIDWNNHYSFNFDKENFGEVLSSINETGGYSFIWPFAKENEFVSLELQYSVKESQDYCPCRSEWLNVLSGQGSEYTPQTIPYDNFNMFEVVNDAYDVYQNKFIIKSNATYEQVTQRIPKNAIKDSFRANLAFYASVSSKSWEWPENGRHYVTDCRGDFDKIGYIMDDGFENYFISQLFTDGFDIAENYEDIWFIGPQFCSRVKGRYIIPDLYIYFDIADIDLPGQFAIVDLTGSLDTQQLAHPGIYISDNGVTGKVQFKVDYQMTSNIEITNTDTNGKNTWTSYIYDSNIHTGATAEFAVFDWPFALEAGTDNFVVYENINGNDGYGFGYKQYEFSLNLNRDINSQYTFDTGVYASREYKNDPEKGLIVTINTKDGKEIQNFQPSDIYLDDERGFAIQVYSPDWQNQCELRYSLNIFESQSFNVSNFYTDDLIKERHYYDGDPEKPYQYAINLQEQVEKITDIGAFGTALDFYYIPYDEKLLHLFLEGEFRWPIYGDNDITYLSDLN